MHSCKDHQMTNSNIVEFPKSKIVRDVPPEIEAEIAKKKEKNKQNYAEAMSEDIVAGLFNELENCGIDSTDEHFQKDFIFASLAIKSLIFRNLGLPHQLHDYVDKTVKIRTLPVDADSKAIADMIDELLKEEHQRTTEENKKPTITELQLKPINGNKTKGTNNKKHNRSNKSIPKEMDDNLLYE